MVAPAGVNEEIPREPAKAGLAQAEPAEGEPAAAPEGNSRTRRPGKRTSRKRSWSRQATRRGNSQSRNSQRRNSRKRNSRKRNSRKRNSRKRSSRTRELAGSGARRTRSWPGAELAGPGEPGLDAAEKHRDVSPLAVAGIILGILALVGAAVGVLAVITHGFRPKTVITYRPAAVFGLRPGECINSAGNGLNVTVLSCATPHDAEVFATFSLPKGPWPGASAVQQDAGNGCVSRLGGYLNPQLATAALSQEYVYPNQAAWQAGERAVVCEVRSVSGQLTGSVRAPS